MKPSYPTLAVLLLTLCAEPSIARAQGVDADHITARAVAFEANAALENKDYAAAAERFARADALVHAPTLLLGLARADVGLGKLVAAREVYERIVREGVSPQASAVFTRAVEDAKRELAALEPHLPSAVVEEKRAPDRPAKPAPPPARISTSASSSISISRPQKTLGFVVLGVGSLALATAAVTGILALERESDLSATCPDDHCPPSARSLVDTYTSLRIAAGSTLLAGAALAVTGTLLILTTPRPRSGGAFVRPGIGAGYLSLEGAF